MKDFYSVIYRNYQKDFEVQVKKIRWIIFSDSMCISDIFFSNLSLQSNSNIDESFSIEINLILSHKNKFLFFL